MQEGPRRARPLISSGSATAPEQRSGRRVGPAIRSDATLSRAGPPCWDRCDTNTDAKFVKVNGLTPGAGACVGSNIGMGLKRGLPRQLFGSGLAAWIASVTQFSGVPADVMLEFHTALKSISIRSLNPCIVGPAMFPGSVSTSIPT